MRIAVLAYHGVNISGNDYASNDHVALREDLRLFERLGLPVMALEQAVELALSPASNDTGGAIALSCDDGSDFDWLDLPHPTQGTQRSLHGILEDHLRQTGIAAHLTSFVIASPEARNDLDTRCLIGKGWWNDSWWASANESPLMSLGNHSWDHNHPAVSRRIAPSSPAGEFFGVDHHAAADGEIRQATDYIRRVSGRAPRLFAYPYGHVNEYLSRSYFPGHSEEHRLLAAFSTEPEPLCPGSDRWAIGRYVCGHHWRSPEELVQVVRDALGRTWSPATR